MPKKTEADGYRFVAEDLFYLCRRAEVYLKRGGDPKRAIEILADATRIAATVGIKEKIIRAQ